MITRIQFTFDSPGIWQTLLLLCALSLGLTAQAQSSAPHQRYLLPLKNFSGIPMAHREADANYFYHGKLPRVMNQITTDAFIASRMFSVVKQPADYQIELTLDEYQLPFKYAPDDTWWQALHDQTDRWLQEAPPTHVKLTLAIKSGQKPIKPFMDSVEMVLSNCDLNAVPQPATAATNQDELSRIYLSTTPGQTFLAATNFLVLRAIERLNQEQLSGQIIDKFGSEIYLASDSVEFVEGQLLEVFYSRQPSGQSAISAGKLEVIKAMGVEALAYPVNLRADHLTVGDWVALERPTAISQPQSHFIAANQCASVYTSEAEAP
jgi:hypothetical protein